MNKTSNSKKKEDRHKFTAECFNNCIEWKLNASIFQNKTSLGYVCLYLNYFRFFQAKVYFSKS